VQKHDDRGDPPQTIEAAQAPSLALDDGHGRLEGVAHPVCPAEQVLWSAA